MIPSHSADSQGTTGGAAASECLRILCLGLSAPRVSGSADALRREFRSGVDWVALAALANAHLVGPALWLAFDRSGLLSELPDDFRDYLGAIHRANAVRLETMRGQALRAFAALNAAGIAPLMLKGGARLVETGSEAGHMMADLDLLVEEACFDDALEVLRRLGYEAVPEAVGERHHAVTLRHAREIAAIDLHRDIGPQRDFIPLSEAIASAVPMVVDGASLRLLSPTHRVMHVFFHSQIHDRGQSGGAVPLRAMEHFAWLVARHGSAIDWPHISRICDRLGLDGAWQAWLYLSERCLGAGALPMQPTRGARLHYRRCLLQLDHPWIEAALRGALGMTEPLSYAHITYKYRCHGRLGLLRARFAECRRLIGKYRHRIPWRLAAAMRDAQGRRS